MLLPPTILGIIHLTTLFSSDLAFPDAFTNSNAELSSSVIFTIVALLGPLLVTTIVKLTKSPTLAFPITSEYLTTVRLTTGSTVMFVSFDVPVLFSFEVTPATFVNVPLVVTLTTTQTRALDPLVKLPIFHSTLSMPSIFEYLPLFPVMLFPESTYTKPFGKLSVILTPVALEGPIFVISIVKLTKSPT